MAAQDLPNIKDLDLFADICTELRVENQQLKDVAVRLGKAPSTVSECIKGLEKQYKRTLITKGHIPKPTAEADVLIEMFNKFVDMNARLYTSGEATHHEIRVLSTRSLLSRLFPGPVAAFMMWLRHVKSPHTARVTVTACDHNELMARLTERGVNAYHWGVCWNLPQAGTNSYLDFSDIPLTNLAAKTPAEREKVSKVCSTPILAVTSDLTHGLQGEGLKELFRTGKPIAVADLWACLDTEPVAVVNTEPEDALRVGLMDHINRAKTIAVPQYEDALHHVRAMDANLAFGPGWFQYRYHVETRYVWVGEEKEFRRKVQLVRRKSLTDDRRLEKPLRDLEKPVLAFYVILRLFLSELGKDFGRDAKDFAFADLLFANGSASRLDDGTGKPGRAMKDPPPDPAVSKISPGTISDWVRVKAPAIEAAIDMVKTGAVL